LNSKYVSQLDISGRCALNNEQAPHKSDTVLRILDLVKIIVLL